VDGKKKILGAWNCVPGSNHTLALTFSRENQAFTLRLNQIRTKKEYCFALAEATFSSLNIGRFKSATRTKLALPRYRYHALTALGGDAFTAPRAFASGGRTFLHPIRP
jgi:hypothetical protein